jgi:pyrimidine oxygenase
MLKFGIFLPNGSTGYIPSTAAPQYHPTFEHNLAISRAAEEVGLDFVLSMMKFKGFGGESHYWDQCLESFTLMAGIAAATSRVQLFPSATLLSTHPAVAARMIATLDDISQGRCGLNIVTGWNKPEYTQMGLWPGDQYYDRRYDFASEYLQILHELWATGESSFQGEFFKLDACSVLPQPGRKIPIVCAGQSPKGIDFTARYGDHSFVIAHGDALVPITARMREAAAANGRAVGIYALFHMIIAPTDGEARRIGEAIVKGGDPVAIGNILKSASMDTNVGGTSDRMKAGLSLDMDEGNLAFMSIPVLHGSPATIAAKIDTIAAQTGIDGMLFSWPDFVQGTYDFGNKVMPLLRQ